MHKLFIISLLLFFSIGSSYGYKLTSGSFSFYSETIHLDYNTDVFLPNKISIQDKSIIDYYKLLEYSDYEVLVKNIHQLSRKLQLNDWLSYELLQSAVTNLSPAIPQLNQSLIVWFLASRMGWNTRLTYTNNKVYIYIQSNDEVFEVPMIEDDGKTFINVTHISENNRKRVQQSAIYLLNFKPNPQGRPFQFILDKLPTLRPVTAEKEIQFNYGEKAYKITIDIDENAKSILNNYPLIAEKNYLRVGFSPTLRKSLVTQLKKLLADKTEPEGLSFLAAFTRTAFKYKEDNDYFGMSKPMIADEVFQYAYSDCEDRSALFFNLVKEIYQLPMLVITYPDHLTIAVSFDCTNGDAIRHDGKNYYICDPTGPINSTRVGYIPSEYRSKELTIIDEYR